MKLLVVCILCLAALSCNNRKGIVESSYIDSLVRNYSPSTTAKAAEGNLRFWEKRCVNQPGDFVAQEKYAHGLISRFHLYTDISDLKAADSLVTELISNRNIPEPGNLLTMVHLKLLEHQFNVAPVFISKAEQRQSDHFATAMLSFDTDFELGDLKQAKLYLQSNKNQSDYAYNFRLSKLEHLYGAPDSAIFHMLKAASVAGNPYVQAIALSNAADLYLHSGKAKEAYDLYKSCIRLDNSDFHSIDRLGWISLVHDKNPAVAKKLFMFLQSHIKSPEPILQLSQLYQLSDSALANKYAESFVSIAGDPAYGNMYNKYLIEAYTDILHQPSKAILIARRELLNRQTPQTYSWLIHALASDNKIQEAYDLFRRKVSGQPLEGLELFWMGKMMKQADKGYNAQEFFKAAKKNEYDLSPAMAKDLNSWLE